MAAGLADFVIGKLGDILVQQIVNETALVFNFTNDFKWLKRKLSILRSSLQYADLQNTQDESVKEWIQNVRDIAFDAEDIFEEYGVESLYSDSTSTQTCGCSYRQLLFRYKMGGRIREIKHRMRSVIEDAKEMKILQDVSAFQQAAASASSTTTQTEVWRRSSVLEWDARPVAVDDKVKEIVSLLEKADVSIIAVVGMGGVGKTFLMQNVYKKVQHMFDNSVWLSISQTYSVPQLQCDLASQIGLENAWQSGISWLEAQRQIHSSLEEKKCLIVLDDVWKPFEEDDLIRRLGLPCKNNNTCKIVVTTRNRQIFSNTNNVYMCEIKPLREEDSWNMFCVYAFSDCPQNRPPPHLLKLSHEIERECAGLPLAIKTVASLMANKKSPRDWELKLLHLKKVKTVDAGDPIMEIIKLSYDLLPASLKSCFAYLSFFPEDHEIDCEYLIYLWAAEGFIPVKDHEDELEIGWGYLNRLANLCLIEVWEDYDGIFLKKKCKVHDLVLDFSIHTSRDNKCAFAVEEAFEEGKSGWRRILLANKGIDNNAIIDRNFSSCPCVRTLSLFYNPIGDNVSANLFSHLRVLRVLDLTNTHISTLPESVGNLKLLRVLNLCRTGIRHVPECVAKLKSIRFLDVSECRDLVEVPAWIAELICLQHLTTENCSQESNRIPPKGISKLLSLRTLRLNYYCQLSIEENDNESLKLEDLANLTELREISIQIKHQVQKRTLEEGGIFARLVNMRDLRIENDEAGEQMANLPETMKAMKDLESLTLAKFLLPGWISAFANLWRLSLRSCECSDYSELSLETMPNLTHLVLIENKSCKELPKAFGKSGAFPKLRDLRILIFNVLEELWEELEDGAMARLEILYIESCPKIKNVPQGLERLKSLKKLRFVGSGTEEVRERLKEGGEVGSKIKTNNPHVSLSFSVFD